MYEEFPHSNHREARKSNIITNTVTVQNIQISDQFNTLETCNDEKCVEKWVTKLHNRQSIALPSLTKQN
jgi:hypothetical protein